MDWGWAAVSLGCLLVGFVLWLLPDAFKEMPQRGGWQMLARDPRTAVQRFGLVFGAIGAIGLLWSVLAWLLASP
ncbi:MAG: hypothetical protein Q7V14_05315 [Coriobacteriia bacterium]|nr:hypothetical protein [Coriobacteriia bacterium]